MAVTLSPPAPPTSLKRVNSDGTPTQAQLDYERAIAKWVSDYISSIAGGGLPFPTPIALGGVKSATAPTHQFQRGIDTGGNPLFAQPVAGDITGLSAVATSGAAADVSGLAAVARTGLASDLIGGNIIPFPTATTLGGVKASTAPANQYQAGIDTGGNAIYATIWASNLQNGVTGSGAVVLSNNPVISGLTTVGLLQVDIAASGAISSGTIATFKDVDGTPTRLLIDSVASVPVLDFRQANGTSSALTASLTNDILGILSARGRGATGYNLTAASAALAFRAAENWTDTAQGSYLTFETTPIGSTTRAIQARINNDGKFGVGRTATTYLFEVAGDIFSTGAFRGSGASLTGITASQVSGTMSATQGGTAQSTWTLGDLLYSSAANTLAKLAGNTTSTRKYLSQTGTGSVSAAPAWAQVAAADISGLATVATSGSASDLGSGTLPVARLNGLSNISNSIGANVLLTNTALYFDGPSVAQGTSGTWFASGTVTLGDTAGAAIFIVRLWDGTTTIDTTVTQSPAGNYATANVSGVITNPAGNLRISVKDISSASGKMVWNDSGLSKDSTISALRIG